MNPNLVVKDVENPNGARERTLFIPAFLEDNAIGVAKDPTYEARLLARDPTTAKALRFGDWNVFAGQFFKEFQRTVHVIPHRELPLDWPRWRAMDWGFAAPWSTHWFARDPMAGRIYVYRELYRVGISDPLQAQLVKDNTLPGEQISFTFADPSMWTKRTVEIIAKSTYDTYLEHGVILTKADNDHRSKYSKAHSIFGPIFDGGPGVQIMETCPNLIRTLGALMSDPNNPEEIINDQEDHAWDSFAYGLTNYVPVAPPKKQEEEPPNPWSRMRMHKHGR